MNELTPVHLDFWLQSSRWFGMSMYPGYGGVPYHSPIHMEGFSLLDDKTFCLDFVNLAYAQGVQNFSVEFEVARGAAGYQVCFAKEHSDRTYIFVPLTRKWMETFFTGIDSTRMFDDGGAPVDREIFRAPPRR